MRYAFVFGDVAVTVQHWVEPPWRGVPEAGARVDVREVVEGKGNDGDPWWFAKPVTYRDLVWRFECIRERDKLTGAWIGAHFHPNTRGFDPGQRTLDDRMSSDPVAWTMEHLADLRGLVERSEYPQLAERIRADQVREALPAMRAAIEASLRFADDDVD